MRINTSKIEIALAERNMTWSQLACASGVSRQNRYLSEARSDLHLLDTAVREYIPDKTGGKADPQMAFPKSDDEILARVKELTANLDTAAQQRVLDIFKAASNPSR